MVSPKTGIRLNQDRLPRLQQEWLGNTRADILAGLVVALALIPEAIAFSIIAGVDPKIGLYASFSIAVIVSITGGRPGMISAATAATAVLMVTLVRITVCNTCWPRPFSLGLFRLSPACSNSAT